MRAQTVIKIEPMGGDRTRIVFTSYIHGSRQPAAQASAEFTRDGIRDLVLDLCKQAGLPHPWRT